MKSFIAAFLSLWLAVSPVYAGSMALLGVGGPSAAAPTYIGAGDVVSGAAAFWGLQAYNSSMRGTQAVNVCNSTGGVDVGCADLITSATTGQLVSATISGITCPGANCTVKIIYDQSGATNCSGSPCDASQSTISSRPTLVASCIGSLPCMQCSGSQILVSPTPTTISQPLTTTGVGERTAVSGYAPWYGDANENVEFGNASISDAGYMSAGTFIQNNSPPFSDNNFHAVQAVFNGISSSFNFDGGTLTSGDASAGSASSAHNICGDGNVGDKYLIGNIAEIGIWPIGFTSTQINNMNTNQHSAARWNF